MRKENETRDFILPKTADENYSRKEQYLDSVPGSGWFDFQMKLLEEEIFGEEKGFDWQKTAKNLQKELDDLEKNQNE